MQTNRVNGRNNIDILNGRKPDLPLVGLDAGGTPNHKIEAAVCWLAFYTLIQPDAVQAGVGLKRLLSLLDQQDTGGHMVFEALTDSHAAIWLRAMLALRIYAAKLRSRGDAYLQLEQRVLSWFEQHRAVLMLGLIPSGPLVHVVALPCARKSPGQSGNDIRDAFLLISDGGKARGVIKGVGPHAYQLDKEMEDNAAVALVTQIVADKNLGFGTNFKRGTLPKLCGELQVDRRAGGHVATFPKGIPGSVDAATSCWVEYSTGRYAFDGSPAPVSIGGTGRQMKVLAAPAPIS